MKLSALLLPLIVLSSVLLEANIAHSQSGTRIPLADGTLGTQVFGGNGNFDITGGVSRGQNLFHSFQDFSVPTGGSATFINPVNNRSIITRVTGGMFSDINGSVNTQGANFLLINPNGVVFGPNVRLDVGRLFLTSTASSIDLVDGGGRIVTFGTNPQGDAPFLAINPNIFFNVSRLNLGGGGGEIRNFGVLQTSNANQYIGLIGGNVTLSGGAINAGGGRVELGGLSAPGSVGLGVEGNSPRVNIPENVARSNVLLTNSAVVDVTGNGGGDIAINARNVQLLGTSRLSGGIFPGVGTPNTVAGDIKINAIERILLDSGSSVLNAVNSNATGTGGNVALDANNVSLQNGSSLSASTFGLGNAGNVTVSASQNVSILGASIFSTVEPGGAGHGGSINVNADSLSLQGANLQTLTRGLSGFDTRVGNGNAGNVNLKINGATDVSGGEINSSIGIGASGNAGNINIDTGSLTLRQGLALRASTSGQGNAGNVNLIAKDSVFFDGSQVLTTVEKAGIGNSGNVKIDASSVLVQNGARIAAANIGQGNAGSVNLTAKDSVSLISSNIFSDVGIGTLGNGGNIAIDSGSVSLKNGSFIQSSTLGQGDSGSVSIVGKSSISLIDSSILSEVGNLATGIGGSIDIRTGSLSLQNSSFNARSFGRGNAGSVTVTAKDSVSFDRADIFSSIGSGGIGKGGSITVEAGTLSLLNGSALQAQALLGGKGSAGDVNVKVSGLIDVAGTRTDLDANGESRTSVGGINSSIEPGAIGNAGRVSVEAGSLSLRDKSFITSSTAGQGNANDVVVSVKDSVSLASGALIRSGVDIGAIGNGGNVTVNAATLSLKNAILDSSTFGRGNAGSVAVNVKDSVSLDTADIFSRIGAGAVGKGGNVTIGAGSLSLQNGSTVRTSINSVSENLLAGRGDAGDVNVKVTGLIDVAGTRTGLGADGKPIIFVGGINSSIEQGATGNAGRVNVEAGSLSLRDGSFITSSTAGQGNANDVVVTAKNSTSLAGGASIRSRVEGAIGNGGDVNVNSGSLSLSSGAFITASTFGQGNAGNVVIKTDTTTSVANAQITSDIGVGARGTGGNISLETTALSLRDNAIIAATTSGRGNAGEIDIKAKESVSSDQSRILSTVNQDGVGQGGRISLNTRSLSLQNGSELSASTFGQGNAGNITVKTTDIVSLTNNSEIASEVRAGGVGKGGNIEINSSSLSLQNGAQIRAAVREAIIPQVDLPAGIPAGRGDAGNVNVNVTGSVDLFGLGSHPSAIGSSVGIGAEGNGGSATVNSGNLSLKDNAFITTSTAGKGNAGSVNVTAKKLVSLDNANLLSIVEQNGIGSGGGIKVDAGSLLLQNGAALNSSTSGRGNAGSIAVDIKDSLTLKNGSSFLSTIEPGSVGKGGNITVNAGSLSLQNISSLQTVNRGTVDLQLGGKGDAGNVSVTVAGAVDIADASRGEFSGGVFSSVGNGSEGNAGNININSNSLSLRNGTLNSLTSGKGDAGNITVVSKDVFSLTGANVTSEVLAGGVGKGGNIDISSNSLSLNSSQVRAATREINPQNVGVPAGRGNAGNVNVKVTGAIDLFGIGANSSAIGSSVEPGTEGNGGSITVNAGALSLRDGAFITASTAGQGNAGTVTVNAKDSLLISGQNGDLTNPFSRLSVSSDSNTGVAGDINVNSPKIALDNGGVIESTSNSGSGGNINISGRSIAETSLSNNSNSAAADALLLRRGGNITTNARGTSEQGSNGGNININSNFIIAVPNENSDINANAVGGRGGNVNINSQGLLGIQNRPQPTSNSDITASSDFGQTGNININTPGIDPGKDKGELPTAPTDATNQISQACSPRELDNKFYITGRGGHPSNIDDQLASNVTWRDPRTPATNIPKTPPTKNTIQPAVGLVFDGKGKATLIAANSEGEITRTRITCPAKHTPQNIAAH